MNGSPPVAEDVAGAILVGGRSSRFGRDKVLLPFGNKPLFAHIYDILAPLVGEVFIVGHHRPEFEIFGLRVVGDLGPDAGPLGGIYTALKSTKAPFVLAIGADMPFLTTSFLGKILQSAGNADAVIPRGSRGLEPLSAVYSGTCIEPMRASLARGNRRIVRALEGMNLLTPEIALTVGGKDPFFNINFPEDYEGMEK